MRWPQMAPVALDSGARVVVLFATNRPRGVAAPPEGFAAGDKQTRRGQENGTDSVHPQWFPQGRHPPDHRRPPARRQGVARGPDHGHGQGRGEAHLRQPQVPRRVEGGVRHRRHHDRRQVRGGDVREQVPRQQRGRLALGYAVLVLRHRDDGPRPADAEGRLGLQRHRAPRRGLPRLHARRLRAARHARLRHLRPRGAEPRRDDEDSRRRLREDP